MHLSIYLGVAEEVLVVFHELSPGLLVERALRERNNEEALDDLEDVRQGPHLRVPVSLERVHADLARANCHIRVEDLRHKVTYSRFRVIRAKLPLGGFCGKSDSITSLHLKIPPSKGVPTSR